MSDVVDVMVLCAGLGTRLRPLTLERPKPAVPFLNRPLIGRTLDLARTTGTKRVVINTHWLPEVMEGSAREEAAALGIELAVSPEPVLLGTGGGLWQARERGLIGRDHHLLVLNGDVLSEADLPKVMATHLRTGAAATMVLRRMPEGGSYTPIEVDESGRVIRIGQHGRGRGSPGALFTGAHILSPEALGLLPSGESSVIATAYASLLTQGRPIQSVFESGLWLDLGDPQGYLDAHLTFLRGKPALTDSSVSIGAGALLADCAIGQGAIVGAGARVSESVIWPGANIPPGAVITRSIVTPHTTVRVDLPAMS